MKDYSQVGAIVLAGGKGTRMNSTLPKVLHTIDRKPIVSYILQTLTKLHLGYLCIVIGYQSERVKKTLGNQYHYVLQADQLGTGHAAFSALKTLPSNIKTVVVINGDDSAFYRSDTITDILSDHFHYKPLMSLLSTINTQAEVSGRVIRNKDGKFIGIKANSQLNDKELASNHELVCGLYVFDRQFLEKYLPKVEISPKGEYNITALINIAIGLFKLHNIILKNPQEWRSINTKKELIRARSLYKRLVKTPGS